VPCEGTCEFRLDGLVMRCDDHESLGVVSADTILRTVRSEEEGCRKDGGQHSEDDGEAEDHRKKGSERSESGEDGDIR